MVEHTDSDRWCRANRFGTKILAYSLAVPVVAGIVGYTIGSYLEENQPQRKTAATYQQTPVITLEQMAQEGKSVDVILKKVQEARTPSEESSHTIDLPTIYGTGGVFLGMMAPMFIGIGLLYSSVLHTSLSFSRSKRKKEETKTPATTSEVKLNPLGESLQNILKVVPYSGIAFGAVGIGGIGAMGTSLIMGLPIIGTIEESVGKETASYLTHRYETTGSLARLSDEKVKEVVQNYIEARNSNATQQFTQEENTLNTVYGTLALSSGLLLLGLWGLNRRDIRGRYNRWSKAFVESNPCNLVTCENQEQEPDKFTSTTKDI